MELPRRRFLALLPPLFGGLLVAACGGGEDEPAASAGLSDGSAASEPAAAGVTSSTQLSPTPACGDDDEPTTSQTEGPYFTTNSPERTSLLESGISGTHLVVEGYVVSTACQPVTRVLVDFWHADAAGEYDNEGYRLRGHQFTDANGRYRLETILPGIYTGRTRHIHVKVQAPGGRVLTTQLYFPADAVANTRDGIYDASLLLADYRDASGGKAGRFDFVLVV